MYRPRRPPPRPLSTVRHATRRRRPLVTLAIESSCDDTAVAVLSHTPGSHTRLLFNQRITSDNRAYKGIHPVTTVQGHNASLAPLVHHALTTVAVPKIDFVSVTRGPGITANLAIGLNVAKGLCLAWQVPLLAVHHMQAHALTPRLSSGGAAACPFPFLSILVSGGHTMLVHSRDLADHAVLATTGDLAIGNLLDQVARVILPPDVLAQSPSVMYARALEDFAFTDGHDYSFYHPPRCRADELAPYPTGYDWMVDLPFHNSRRLAYSFSGIHSRVHELMHRRPDMDEAERRCLARHTQRAAFQHVASRLLIALEDVPDLLSSSGGVLVLAGGVAANKFLLHVVRESLAARGYTGVRILVPPADLCTDNAAMVAWAGMEMYLRGWSSDLSIRPMGKWPLEVPGRRDGILAADGWLRRRDVDVLAGGGGGTVG